MAHWKHTLDISDVWASAQAGNTNPQGFARAVWEKLRRLHVDDEDLDHEREELEDEFSELAFDTGTTFDDTDDAMSRLYDWADTKLSGEFFGAVKLCWVKTNF